MKDNIYVIYSTSYRLLEEEINKIVGKNNYITYDANEVPIDDIIDSASYVSLFDDKNYFVVKNVANFASKKGSEVSSNDDKLIKYLDEPNDNTILILIINDKMNGVKKVSKIVKDKYNYIEINNPNTKEMREIINKYLKKQEIKMDYDSITYIINGLEGNYDLILNELEKILLYGKKNLSFDDVSHIVSSSVLDDNFKFIDAIINRDIKTAFKYYDDYLLNKNSPIMILSMLANEFRNILLVKDMMRNNNRNDIMKTLGFKYSFQLDKVINNSYKYNKDSLENYLIYLCNLDYDIKMGRITDKLALELAILKFDI